MSPFDPSNRFPEAALPSQPSHSPPDSTRVAPPPGADAATSPDHGPDEPPVREVPRLQRPARGRRLARQAEGGPPLTPQQRLLLLDAWRRSRLPAGDFTPLVGISKHTLEAWNRKFQEQGPAGLADQPHGQPPAGGLPPGLHHEEGVPPRLGRREG